MSEPIFIRDKNSSEEKLLEAIYQNKVEIVCHFLKIEKVNPNYQWYGKDYRWGEAENHCYLSEICGLLAPYNKSQTPESLAIAELLLKAGAYPDGVKHLPGSDYWVEPPLLSALSAGNQETAVLLIDYGARVNVQNTRGDTPIMLAASKNNVSLIQKLLSKGANLIKKNNGDLNIFHWVNGVEAFDFLITLPQAPRLLMQKNCDGLTPYEYLKEELEDHRTYLKKMQEPNYKQLPGAPVPLLELIEGNRSRIQQLQTIVQKLQTLEDGYLKRLTNSNPDLPSFKKF